MALVRSEAVYQALRDKGLVAEHPDDVQRCIVDLRPREPARILIERLGDEGLLSLGDLLDGETGEGGETTSSADRGGQ